MTQPALDFAAPVSVYTTHRAEVQAEVDTARLLRQQDIINELTGEVGQLYQKCDRMARRFAEVSAGRVA